ncbi:hypothetical protein GCM10009795_048270 [Nocardioides hankookensis]|uniref:CHRD domain-containing protein n=1 Tax=Nocardioides hankookensis TaxID=443157 RepID=A0ABW1LGD9_9ACTN
MTNRTPAVLALSAALPLLTSTFLVDTSAHADPAQRAVVRLETRLRPSGDPDGAGQAHLTFDRARGRVCATVEWRRIQRPDSAHIHRVSDGSIVVDLGGSVTGGPRCTTGVPSRTIAQILRHPRQYYVNVHNPTYPAGAIQGTLHR